MNIRRLGPLDYDLFFELRLASLIECPEEFATDANDWRNAPKETIYKLLTASEERIDAPILGAWDEAQLVGLIGLKHDVRPSVTHKSTLWGFYVIPAFRRKGIGMSLLSGIFSAAREIQELRQIRAVVTITSTAALALLEKAGFERFGQEPEAKKVNDVFYDQIYFVKSLL